MPENQGGNSQLVLRLVTGEDGASRLMLAGSCTLAALGQQLQSLSAALAGHAADPELHWDLTGIAQMDAAGAVLLWHAWGEHPPRHLVLQPEHERLFNRLEKMPAAPTPPARDPLWPITVLGK